MAKKTKIVLVCLFFFLSFKFFPLPALAKEFSFPRVEFKVEVFSDGSFQVEEKRTYDFDGSFSWADYYIPLGDYQIKDFQIADQSGEYLNNTSGKPGSFFTDLDQDQLYAKWFYTASDQEKTFTISYRVDQGINLHQDIASLYWQFIGLDWDKGVKEVSGQIVLPGEVKDDLIWCFGHGPLTGKVEIPNNQECLFSASNLASKQFLEIRFLFDKGLVNNQSLTTDKQSLTGLLAEEEAFAQETEKKKNILRIGDVLISCLTLVCFLVFSSGVFVYLKKWWQYGRDLPLPRVNLADKLHQPPSSLAPAMVDGLLKMSKNLSTKVFLATVLSLIQKRVIKINSRKKVKKSLFGQKTGYDYSLLETGQEADLLDFEQDLLEFIFSKVGRGSKEVKFKEIEKYSRRHKKDSYQFFQDFKKKAFKRLIKDNYLDKKSHQQTAKVGVWQIWLGFVLTLAVFVLAVFIMSKYNYFSLGFLASLSALVIEGIALFFLFIFASFGEKRTSKGREEAAGWKAFKNWLKDYSVTKKCPID